MVLAELVVEGIEDVEGRKAGRILVSFLIMYLMSSSK